MPVACVVIFIIIELYSNEMVIIFGLVNVNMQQNRAASNKGVWSDQRFDDVMSCGVESKRGWMDLSGQLLQPPKLHGFIAFLDFVHRNHRVQWPRDVLSFIFHFMDMKYDQNWASKREKCDFQFGGKNDPLWTFGVVKIAVIGPKLQ